MFSIHFSQDWRLAYPGAHIGMLLLGGVDNTPRPTRLDERKTELTARLRTRYAGLRREALLELDILQAYKIYYKRFKKTYHVLLQLESLVSKAKPLPAINPLVDAGFMAELETLILTAAHDAALLAPPVTITVSSGNEQFIQMGGTLQELKTGDMIMTDAAGVVCSILYGQDQRTPVTPATTRALYVAYAPPGIPALAVQHHLELTKEYVQLFTPQAAVEHQAVYPANPG
jgi:DNA/RNA-binding domain of Phe-tRNA-synthetase-like protein